MFGYFRFFLANLVMISHVGVTIQGFNPGVVAVVSFYMLAGFVVCNLFSRVFVSETPLYLHFYFERALRILPQYFFVACLTIIFIIATEYGFPKFELTTLLNNFIIIPLNYYMFIDNSLLQEPKWWLIPPAWSLGAEIQAYLILPFIIYFKPIKIVVAIASLCIFIAASIGLINTDYFGYRLIPGILFIFILGISVYKQTSGKKKPDFFDRYFPGFVCATLIFLLLVLGALKMLHHPFVKETILGILIGIPTITYLAKSKIKAPVNHILGELSYGLFLSHFLAMWVNEHFALIDKSTYLYLYITVVFLISLLISITGVFVVERRIKIYRFKLSKSIKQ